MLGRLCSPTGPSLAFSPVISGAHRQICEGRAVAPRQHRGRELQEEAENLGIEENLFWAAAIGDRQQHPSLAWATLLCRVIREAAAHPKQDGAAQEMMAPSLLWERLKGFIALGDNSVSTAICAECSFFPLFHSAPALTLSLPFAAHPRCQPALGELHVPCSCSQCLQGQDCAAMWGLCSTAALQVLFC